jgi:hypothetical protein
MASVAGGSAKHSAGAQLLSSGGNVGEESDAGVQLETNSCRVWDFKGGTCTADTC